MTRLVLFSIAVAVATCSFLAVADASVTYFEPEASSGISLAATVPDIALAHTSQLLPLDGEGKLAGGPDAEGQLAQVLQNIQVALALAETDLKRLIKLNFYVTTDSVADAVRRALPQNLPEQVHPAASFVVAGLPYPGALVAADAVAAAPTYQGDRVVHRRSRQLYGHPDRGHVSLMPPGGRVYLSGQAAGGGLGHENPMLEATRRTMVSLHATLAYVGLSADDVVQVKVFLHPMAEAEAVETQISAFYRNKPTPPLVFVEWNDGSYLDYLSEDSPIEIEIHAAGGEKISGRKPGSTLTYSAPPDLSAPLTYARIVEVHRFQKMVYFSGIYGDPEKDAMSQTREAFATLARASRELGTDLRHLVRGTYYVASEAASDAMNTVRLDLYDPARPPASSKMPVSATGLRGAVFTFDMIAVVPE